MAAKNRTPNAGFNFGERQDWEKIKRETEAAVKSGKMTRQQADAKYRAIRERTARKNPQAK